MRACRVRLGPGEAAARTGAIGTATETLHHRGPDETGVRAVGDDIVVGFMRLSIIDRAQSRQPMSYVDC